MFFINRERILQMDIIRSVAILAVIGIHVSGAVLGSNPSPLGYNITFVFNQICRFSVPAFIFISGMGLSISYRREESYFHFLVKRFKKILPQYFVWCLIYIFAVTRNFNIRQDINYIIYGKVFYHLYFIPLIVELYIVFPWIYRFIDKRWFLLFSFAVSTSVIIYTYYFIDVTPDMWFWNKKNLLYWLFYFCLGGYIGKHRKNILPKIEKYKYVTLTGILISTVYVLYPLAHSIENIKNLEHVVTFQRPSIVIYSVLLILFILGLNLKNRLIIGTIEYISRRTYSIYLCHALVLFLCIKNITNFYSANSLHFELAAYLITFFGALLITELKKFL
ncbi:acyltransferase [Clostridium sp.]|uniref:acyltransferase n=2 Tax=Clostridium sp. TaxID=1506 RepID=UPI0025BCC8C8|nr:acyltransferase [Clostridium sp.]MCI1715721.1 acyltransferase [Clostridium sp.]MCI1800074.1 acyltransferase [Clostridium sp.]MCI1813988.1 acyltransferase [Clostridium sp.]MCI1870886.1 acyltransferase [Clostridium sp.]MCI2200070.1 acyltransferase [Clostridium sp.]